MASSSSSKPEVMKPSYDVFINHRGAEVKHTLAASIYDALCKERLRGFLDSEELQFGDSLPHIIEEAMLSASVHIAIFSPHYAQSPWCLAELSFMIKTGKKIIPIYYYVEPSDLRFVRHGKGIYASAFAQHENGEYTSETIERWKKALHKVSSYKGPIVHDQVDELMLSKEIVATILTLMNRAPLGEYKVGLSEAVKDAEKLLQSADSHGDIQILAIVGMGGRGKTTLAEELYKRKASYFRGFSFIPEVRKVSRDNLPRLRKKLLKDLLADVEGFTIDNISEDNVAPYLRSRRVLIVLDDLEHKYQLEALMAEKDNFGPGSLIIITTREKDILESYKGIRVHEMKPMDRSHAEQLFSWYAFYRFSPLPGFEDLVGKFVEHCDGLPLTLKVLGDLLRGRGKDFWESQSRKISKLVTKEVKDRLKLSYDALDKERKNMFLDIACFYVGKDKNLTVYVCNQSGWEGERSLEMLINKSLVELDNRNRIKMHSHLRDLGRQIALDETPIRLFSEETGEDYLDDDFDEVFQIWVSDNKNNPVALRTRGDYIMGESIDRTRFLRWLEWYDCPQSNIPSGISLENLRILDLKNGFFNKLWLYDAKVPVFLFTCNTPFSSKFNYKGSSHSALFIVCAKVQLPKLLEELYISGSIGEFPKSIRQLENLQKIVIDGWPNTSLKALPEEFCDLKSLEHLTLRCCKTLTKLPWHLGNLRALQHLDLAFCDRLKELPHSFEQLVNLSYLSFQGCERLLISPHFLGEIRGLERLNFMDCRNLNVLPAEVPCQEFLRSLNLIGTSLERLPNEVGRLVNLEVLEIGSSYLTDLPISLGNMTNLRTLNLEDCKNLKYLPASLGLMEDLCIKAPPGTKRRS